MKKDAAKLLRPFGWPEEGATLADILEARALTWVTCPRPVAPERKKACEKVLEVLAEPARAVDHLLRAAAWLWLQQDERFFHELHLAEEKEPASALVSRWKAYGLLKVNDGDGALKAIEPALSAEPRSAWGLTLRAEAKLRAGRPAEALVDLDAALALEPGRLWTLVLCSEAHRDQRRYDEALRCLNRVVELHPVSWSYAVRARTAFNFRDQAAALADLDKAIALDARFWEGYAYRAEAYRRVGRFEEAYRDADKALKAAPNSPPRIYSWRGAASLSLGDFEGAVKDLTPVIEKEEERLISWALSQRAKAWLGLNRFHEAVADMNRAVKVDPKHGWIYGIAERAGNTLEKAPEILRKFSAVVKKEPKWPWGWAWRGETRYRAGQYEDAISDLSKAIALAPKEAWFRAWRGLAKQGLGDKAGARADFTRAIALDPAYPAAYGWRANLAMLSGDYGKARADLDRLLERDKRCSWGYGWRGECLVKLGELSKAIRDLEDAVNLDARYGDAWAWLCEARRQSGDPEAALAAAERALEGNGDKALAHLVRGMARGARGDAAGQVEDFKRAAELRPALLGEKGAALLAGA